MFKKILSLLRIRKGNDFTYYKQTTIRRRILRRMAFNKDEELSAYLKFLQANKNEQDLLYQDFLIPVTNFFRDPKSFENLCNSIFPRIIKNKKDDEVIRIWVAGCSTGEEAYTIAICLREILGSRPNQVQIFATDLSELAIRKARKGIYLKTELQGINAQRLEEYFIKTNGSYQVNKHIRDMCVFAVHNFLKEPPFGKLDFISCRNVLIYMEPFLQKKALTAFHYSLNLEGFLMLGKSENINSAAELFTIAVKKDKIFSRNNVYGKFMVFESKRNEQNFRDNNINPPKENMRIDFQKTADDIMLSKFSPVGVIVNEAMNVVHFRGNTSNYLELASGKPTHNLFKLAKQNLPFELRNILHKAKKEKAPSIKENIPIKINDNLHHITIEAIPLNGTVEPHYLILFHKTNHVKLPMVESEKSTSKKDEKNLRIQQLESELTQARIDMRSITEDQEATNEELQSTNEELSSSIEELQSLNEELETGKEELESTNEEVTLINNELVSINDKVIAERNFSEAIIDNLHEPLVVLDYRLRIKICNHAFYKTFLINEMETDDKLIYELDNGAWNIPELKTLLENILPHNTKFAEFELRHKFSKIGERILLLNAKQIIRKNRDETLILLSFKDITESKMSQEKMKEKNAELERINKELESFAYISSHDLQEPLRKIQSFISLILEKEENNISERGKDYFGRIQKAAQRMQSLIQDLLAYSRTNITKLKFEVTDLNKIIEEVKDDLKEELKEKNATIEANQLCNAKIIPFQFRQLMHNLISNSLKFSNPENPPHIQIKCEIANGLQFSNVKLAPQGKYCHVEVSDNGIGFKKEYSEKIFNLFQRLHGRDEYNGTGIGLAIVKKIVDNHNGIITAEGELEKGARFDIYFPT